MKEIMQTTCFGHVDIVLNVSSSYFFNVLLTASPAGQQHIFAFLKCLLLNSHRSYLPCLPCTALSEVLLKVQTEQRKATGFSLPTSCTSGQRSSPERGKNSKHISPGTAFRAGHNSRGEAQRAGSPNVRTVPRSGSSPTTAVQR